jgi:hypothetical protein
MGGLGGLGRELPVQFGGKLPLQINPSQRHNYLHINSHLRYYLKWVLTQPMQVPLVKTETSSLPVGMSPKLHLPFNQAWRFQSTTEALLPHVGLLCHNTSSVSSPSLLMFSTASRKLYSTITQ